MPEGVDVYNVGILFGSRGLIPIGKINVMLDVDFGWQQLMIEGFGQTYSTSGMGFAFGAGAQYRILDYLAAGIMIRYHLPIPTSVCQDPGDGSGENCVEPSDDFEQSHDFMFGISVTGNLPI